MRVFLLFLFIVFVFFVLFLLPLEELSSTIVAFAFYFFITISTPFFFSHCLSPPTAFFFSEIFFLASIQGWQYFSSRLLHAISLKIIRVKLLAEVLALEEHQLFRAWKALWWFHPGLSSRVNPCDWIGWWRYIDSWEQMAV